MNETKETPIITSTQRAWLENQRFMNSPYDPMLVCFQYEFSLKKEEAESIIKRYIELAMPEAKRQHDIITKIEYGSIAALVFILLILMVVSRHG